jgi:beta-galactosidase/beta-glucuronidase
MWWLSTIWPPFLDPNIPVPDEAILEDIRCTKLLGFNGVRKHQKVEDPRFLYWADREGLLVAAEMPTRTYSMRMRSRE